MAGRLANYCNTIYFPQKAPLQRRRGITQDCAGRSWVNIGYLVGEVCK
jgi:hypothetical protein